MEDTTWKVVLVRWLLLLIAILLLLICTFPPREIFKEVWNLKRSQWLQSKDLLQTTCNEALINVTDVANLWYQYLGAALVHIQHRFATKLVAKTERSRSNFHQNRNRGMEHNLQIEDRIGIGIACQDYSDQDHLGLDRELDGMSPLDNQVSIHFFQTNKKNQESRRISTSETSNLKEEPFTGMLLQVYQNNYRFNRWDVKREDAYITSKQQLEVELSGRTQQSIESIDMEVPLDKHATATHFYQKPCRSLQEYGDDGSSGIDFNEYQLLEQTHGDLGVSDIYSLDFAYRPVAPLAPLPFRSTPTSWTNEYSKGFAYEKLGERAFAGGSHGEVWKARRRCNLIVNVNVEGINQDTEKSSDTSSDRNTKMCDDSLPLIMKRLKVNQGLYLMEAGLREIYFGEILSRSDGSESLFTTLVDHFYRRPTGTLNSAVELWIVFENAGPSLRSYIYTPVNMGDFVIFQHSDLWRNLRLGIEPNTSKDLFSVAIVSGGDSRQSHVKDYSEKSKDSQTRRKPVHNNNSPKERGRSFFRKILKQILTSAAKLHSWGIVHRDIKPSNIMCKMKNDDIACVLGDFSSAWDQFSSQNLYSNGPSRGDQTDEYAPPEVLFGEEWIPFNAEKPESYDSWSIGVVALELLLGSPNVFSVDQRTTTLLTNKMKKEGANDDDIQRALYLAALSQFCMYIPTTESSKNWPLREGDPLFQASIVKTTCTIQDFHTALRARDPLGKGFDESIDPLLQLLWGLLSLNPLERLTASEALEHFYFSSTEEVSSCHNALESQIIDPRLDMNVGETQISDFECPKCGRKFGDLQSCLSHANGRKHAKFCIYDRSLLPPCLNAHSMLPAHPTSGYCDIQGRRKSIEDFHTIHLAQSHQFYGVFDGHSGNLASKYAASELYKRLVERMEDLDADIEHGHDWVEEVTAEMVDAFEEVHEGVLKAIQLYPGEAMSKAGTTATALFVTEQAVVVAAIGDSRAVLSVGASYNSTHQARARQLTVDHTASNEYERRRVEKLGGHVSLAGGTLRVNGTLVLTRSIGDPHLAKFLSRTPDVIAMTKHDLRKVCSQEESNEMPCFIVLASDGLWDVMSNQESIDMVQEIIRNSKSSGQEGGAFQEAAEILTQEAYVRGSTDNIGVCVVAIT